MLWGSKQKTLLEIKGPCGRLFARVILKLSDNLAVYPFIHLSKCEKAIGIDMDAGAAHPLLFIFHVPIKMLFRFPINYRARQVLLY